MASESSRPVQSNVNGPDKIYAPFTREQVVALNEYQRGPFHPFTCRDRGDHIGEGELVATTRGWICPQCRYEQDWALASMVRPPMNFPSVWTDGTTFPQPPRGWKTT